VHVEELWDITGIRLDFRFFEPEALGDALRAAGFEVVETLIRPPYVGVEVETERFYLWVRGGGAGGQSGESIGTVS